MGHRSMPHTADIRIEAWAPSREECVAEAVRAMVEGFADITASKQTGTAELLVDPGTDEDLLIDVLDEVIFRLETAGQLPLAVEVTPLSSGARVDFRMTDVDFTEPVGAAPKAVSLHDLQFGEAREPNQKQSGEAREPNQEQGGPGAAGWSCAVTLDV